jgi:hypothetical protein
MMRPREKSPATEEAVAGCNILLCRPAFQLSLAFEWQLEQAAEPINSEPF